ncbi:SUZ domain-containing protein 1-like [Huso huso]|uniref:SUZ RNA-binding domain-containing n=1 Tax=Huso huso TaxID=61971 RepID=A0ABR0YJ11_HUSHU
MEDDEVAESWEEAADSGEPCYQIELGCWALISLSHLVSRKSRSPLKTPIVIQDDSLPAAPPPQIRILKRPSSNGSLGASSPAQRPPAQVKTLAQREAEYAEARRRILGSASPEEEPEKPIPTTDRYLPVRVSAPLEEARPPNNVIRQPTGPDGTQGFRQWR